MFRKQALKKGAIKPIHAQVGIMVGAPYGSPTPRVIPGETPYTPRIQGPNRPAGPPKPTMMQNFMRNPVVRFGGRMISLPAYLGYEGTGVLTNAMGMQDSPYKTGLQLAGAYGATRLPAAAAVAGLGIGPQLGIAALGAGGYYAYQKAQEQKARIAAMTPKEREEFFAQQRGQALAGEAALPTDEELFGKFVPKAPDAFKPKTDARVSTRPGFDKGKLKAEGDELLDDKYASVEGDANLNSIQADALGNIAPVPPEGQPPQLGGTSTVAQAEATTKGQTPKLTVAEKLAMKEEDEKVTKNIIATGGVSGDPSFDQTIKLAKRYYDEVFENRGSQANLIFLANLASGLLTGTTRKAGVGGAMEVLGQALGPAVNNYVTVKLKEGELRSNRREASLNAAMDHMKFLNDAARKVRPEVTAGVIQIEGADGVIRNYNGYQDKGGTAYLPGGLGPDGQETLVPVSQGEPVRDSSGEAVGSFFKFLENKDLNDRQFKLKDRLGNRYNALSVTRDVLKTLNQLDESGDKVKAGAALSVDTVIRRVSGVAKELVGLDILDNDITTLTLGELEDKVSTLQEDEFRMIDQSDLSDAAKKEAKELVNKDNLIKKAKERLKDRGLFSGLSREEQEKLAVQEVTLVYALANTFKDQDRLTQRDIDAARDIVNIFSLGRSSADVRASISAIAKNLESDIRRTEELYRDAGGLEKTITNLRKLSEFQTFEQGVVDRQLTQDLGIEEIEKILDEVDL